MNIFISYSQEDKNIATLISQRLEESGHQVWLDHKKMKAGDNILASVHPETPDF